MEAHSKRAVAMKITDTLVVEHRILQTLFDQIDRLLSTAATLGEVKMLASLMESLLEEHGDMETNIAYFAFDHVLNDKSQLARLHQEHQEIDASLREVRRARSRAQASRLLAAAIHFSRMHMQFEEHSVFPLLESVLQHETLNELGAIRELRRAAG